MNRSLAVVVLGVAFVVGGVLKADAAGTAVPVKIGYVDLQRTLSETPTGKKAKARLEKDKSKKQAELKKKEKELTDFAAELDKQRAVLKPDILAKREQELQQRYVALQELYMQLQQDLAKQEATLVREIFAKASPIIEKVARAGGYTLILEKSESAVLYGDPSMDLTAQINAQMK
jgi:outer membrane protein